MPSQYEYMTQEEIHSFITQQLELHNQSLQVASTSTSSKWGYAIGAAVVVATGGYFALCRWKKQTRSVAREPKPVKVLKQKHVAVESEKCAAADVDRFASELKVGFR
eukprot:comp20912_c0_seq2/m.27881 comp20912_c0_seq2/g.27881  ORF comp20912_c0_seq2/g.27881 comp20912_c0_seq2/m.27881 type:complete len:107 (-) comp20912_c0_seq2:75-395(-)